MRPTILVHSVIPYKEKASSLILRVLISPAGVTASEVCAADPHLTNDRTDMMQTLPATSSQRPLSHNEPLLNSQE